MPEQLGFGTQAGSRSEPGEWPGNRVEHPAAMMTPTFLHTAPLAPTLDLFAPHQPPTSLSSTELRQSCPFSRLGNQASERDAVECYLCVTQHSWGMMGQALASSPDCRAASSGSWGAVHPAPLSSHAAKGESPSQHFPFEEPQVEDRVGCDPG